MSIQTSVRNFFHKRRLYPTSLRDRILLWGGCFAIVLLVGSPWGVGWFWRFGRVEWTAVAIGVMFFWAFLYVIQDSPKDDFGTYTSAIAEIEGISGRLSELVDFLKAERQRLEESEATLRRLHNEKTQLEPVVLAHRDTVNAILAAYARTNSSRAWKERAVGFVSGLMASFLASLVLEYFRRK